MRTQTDHVAELQQESGEVWGRTPRQGLEPTVQAYQGPLPDGCAGTEFTTTLPVDANAHPLLPTWAGSRADVQAEDDFAKISVEVTKVVWKNDGTTAG